MRIGRSGFTIIEVMLFLAVTGALTIAIMVGMGANISAQRYKDSTSTFQSDIQQQFEDAVSVLNFRTGGTPDPCSDAPRGASDCVVLGKFMVVGEGSAGGDIRQYSVYGREPSSSSETDEYLLMQSYNPAVLEDTLMSSQMEWGVGVTGLNGSPLSVGILVLRSPKSGSVYAFTRDSVAINDLSSMINDSSRSRRIMCVSPSGWLVRDRMAVIIREYANSANAVEVRTGQMLAEEGIEC